MVLKDEMGEKGDHVKWLEGCSSHFTKQFFNGSIEIRFPNELHCIAFVQGCHWEEKGNGIGGWRGKEGTRRGDYRRHCSLCERLSLARQGGGTLWILMNWQDSPQHQLHLRAMRTTSGRRRRWLGRYSLSMAKQTEQVIFPVIIIAITRHEGLVMDLLILHGPQKQPARLSKGKAWWCVFLLSVGWLQ